MTTSGKKTALLLAFLLVFSFSTGMLAMDTDDMGSISDCPFMGMDSICQMSLFEHMGTFRNMFTGIPGKSILLTLTIMLMLVLAIPAIKQYSGIPPDKPRLFLTEYLRLPNFNKILLALSDGTIQPKLYDNA